MLKKAQITIFIIIGILIIGMIILFYQLYGFQEYEDPADIPESGAIKTLIKGCIYETTLEAIYYLGQHGGYYDVPLNSYRDEIPYYFFNEQNLMPTKTIYQNEINNYIDDNLFFCTQNIFEIYPELDITSEEVKSKTTITQNGFNVYVKYPVYIKKMKSKVNLEDFTVDVYNIYFDKIYNAIDEIIVSQQQKPDLICTSCILDIADRYNLHVDIERFNESVIFTITDFNSSVYESEYKFMFAAKYDEYTCENPPKNAHISFYYDCINEKHEVLVNSNKLIIEDVNDMVAYVDESFSYQIIVSGLNVNYYDSTYLFDINTTTGNFEFIPTNDLIGNHTVWITVKDTLENEDYIIFNIEIKEETQ